MKKLILPLVAGVFVLASCKKDYTCTCTETDTRVTTYTGNNASVTSTDVTKTESKVLGVKKSTVVTEDNCYSNVYEKTTTNTGSSTVRTITTDCEISK